MPELSSPLAFYIFAVLIYAAIGAVAALGFNLQFGYAGVFNMAYIVLVAVGAYGTAIANLPPSSSDPLMHYIGGFGWAFPWDMLFGVACTLVFAAILGSFAFRRLREDYLAVTLVVIGAGFSVLVSDDVRFFNGLSGLSGIAGPWQDQLDPGMYQLAFLGLSLVAMLGCWFLFNRLTSAPFGRVLRAVREDQDATASLARNPWRLKMAAFLLGALAAGISGSLLVMYFGAWNTAAWLPTETLILVAAIIVGGRGRHAGAIVGAFLVLGLIAQATKFIPSFTDASVLASLQSMAIGVLLFVFLWWRPQGLLPEKKDRYPRLVATGGTRSQLHVPSTPNGHLREARLASSSALEVAGVSASYGGTQAVRNVSLTIPTGQFIGLIGPNGAGKTTLLDCISGMKSYRGRVSFQGTNITGWPVNRVAERALVRTFQVPRIYRRLTVVSNVMLGASHQRGEGIANALVGSWHKEEQQNFEMAWSLLQQFGLERVAHNYGSELSGGQERLVELCRLLMMKPKMILLDEPFSGVSPANRERLAAQIMALRADPSFTILMIEHRLEFVERMCDRIVVMGNGSVIADGTMQQVRADPTVVTSYLGRATA
jgi:ABC-type branched-subunit amino acid transport system ATPase component/ABC-type branched-subunit amino acid transport system permease subunit